MALDIGRELATLKQMSVRELREKYEAVFGEPTRAGNRDFLFKRIAWRIQSLAEGDLSERARRRADVLARDADLPGIVDGDPAAEAGHRERQVPDRIPGSCHLAEFQLPPRGGGEEHEKNAKHQPFHGSPPGQRNVRNLGASPPYHKRGQRATLLTPGRVRDSLGGLLVGRFRVPIAGPSIVLREP